MIRSMFMGRLFILIRLFTTRLITAARMPPRRLVGGLALRWAPSGAAVGVGAAAGAAATSTLIGTIISIAIPTSTTSAATGLITATGSAAETARRSGNTIRLIAAARLTLINAQRTDSAARLAEIHSRIVNAARAIRLDDKVEISGARP